MGASENTLLSDLRTDADHIVDAALVLGALASWMTEKTPGTPRTWKWMEWELTLADRIARRW